MRLGFRAARSRAVSGAGVGAGGGRAGGTAGAVLNAANEAAVAAFLARRAGALPRSCPACRSVLEHHDFDPSPTLERVASSSTAGLARRLHVGYALDRASLGRTGSSTGITGADRRGRRRPGVRDLRPRVGPLPRGQAVRREVREVLPRLRHRRPEAGQFRWGETEYGIGILPLGGYVKMLGQEDNPAKAAEECERAKLRPRRCRRRHTARGGGRRPRPASSIRAATWPRACRKRMAIISAGVIMNVIFAFVVAVIAYEHRRQGDPCVVGRRAAGRSGLAQPACGRGTKSSASATSRIPRFRDLQSGVALGEQSRARGEVRHPPPRRRRAAASHDLSGAHWRAWPPRIGILSASTRDAGQAGRFAAGAAGGQGLPLPCLATWSIAVAGTAVETNADIQKQFAHAPRARRPSRCCAMLGKGETEAATDRRAGPAAKAAWAGHGAGSDRRRAGRLARCRGGPEERGRACSRSTASRSAIPRRSTTDCSPRPARRSRSASAETAKTSSWRSNCASRMPSSCH